MNKAVARLLSLGIKARTLWLVALLFTAVGFYLGLGWAYIVLRVPEIALGLIAQVQS